MDSYSVSLLSLPSPPPPHSVQLSSLNYIFLSLPLYFDCYFHETRTDHRIRISYIMEKAAATLGSIGLMIVITEQYVLPTIQHILPSQTAGMTFIQKLGELGWVLLDMIFPYISLSIRLSSFVLVYLSSWFPSPEALSWVRRFIAILRDFLIFLWRLIIDSLHFIYWLFMSFLN